MPNDTDSSVSISEQVKQAYAEKTALRISAGGSKSFYGNLVEARELDVTAHSGIIDYHPSELVLSARCGTKLSEIEQLLRDNDQRLAFEPPQHSIDSTFGGAIASGLSGPGRAFAGSARDFVLGTRIVNGKGEDLRFGGQVMKNVAGYDVSRLMCGAQGSLGVLLDISVKVLPLPESEVTLQLTLDEAAAHDSLRQWLRQGHPISASCYRDGHLSLRLSSTRNSVRAAQKKIGGDVIDNQLWQSLRDQTHDFFKQDNLWRLSLPPASEPLDLAGKQLIEWGGAQRWTTSDTELFDLAKELGGHATRYTMNRQQQDCFQPLDETLLSLQQRIKKSLDPESILNPGRMYKAL